MWGDGVVEPDSMKGKRVDQTESETPFHWERSKIWGVEMYAFHSLEGRRRVMSR